MLSTTPARKQYLIGIACILVSAASFGAMAIFIKICYAAAASPLTVLALRFGIASLVLAALMLVKGYSWPKGKDLFILAAMGGIGYVGMSFCFFSALQHASAGLAALLLYLYPAMVSVLGWLLFGQKLSWHKSIALAMALLGLLLLIGSDASGTPLGILLGCLAAFTYSLYIITGSRQLQKTAPVPATTIVMAAAALVYITLAAANGLQPPTNLNGWLAIFGIALISTVVAMVTFFQGLARLSAADAASLSILEPLVTVLLAVIFLGESVTPMMAGGGCLTIASLLIISRLR